jgi:hypothetical protein
MNLDNLEDIKNLKNLKSLKSFFFSFLLIITISCSKKSAKVTSIDGLDASSNASESVMAATTANATATEGNNAIGFLEDDFEYDRNDKDKEKDKEKEIERERESDADNLGLELQAMDYLDPKDEARELERKTTATTCTLATARALGCNGNVMNVTWNSCNIGLDTMTGGWTETYDSSATCTTVFNSGAIPIALPNSGTVFRATNPTSIKTFSTGAVLTEDTYNFGGTTYDGTTILQGGILLSKINAATRILKINGLHKIFTGPHGKVWYDHTILANPGLSITGARASSNRTVNGQITLYHNVALYRAISTFSNVVWGSSICCYPTSGTITSTITGSVTGSTSLSFLPGTNTCGQATFTDTSGTQSTITLIQCL